MRVVWITHNYPRFAGDVAGAFLHPLAIELCTRGIDLQVIAPSDAGEGGEALLDGVPVRRVRYGSAASERVAYRGTMAGALQSPPGVISLLRLRAALRRGATDALAAAPVGQRLVHAHWWIPGGWAAPDIAPLVLTSHGTDLRLLDRVPIANVVAKPIFRRARVVTTVSASLAEIARRRTGVTIAANAIQPMPVVDVPRPWTDASGGVVIIGRLTPQKRVHLAIDAIASLRERGSALTLTIIGDGADRAALERRAQPLGSAFRFAGQVAPDAIPGFLATARCCVMPAIGEGFGLAAAEALMQGVPVVACDDGGGLLDVVPRTGAGRVVAATADAIAQAITNLIDHADAATDARRLGDRWRVNLSAAHVAERCLEWYFRALHA